MCMFNVPKLHNHSTLMVITSVLLWSMTNHFGCVAPWTKDTIQDPKIHIRIRFGYVLDMILRKCVRSCMSGHQNHLIRSKMWSMGTVYAHRCTHIRPVAPNRLIATSKVVFLGPPGGKKGGSRAQRLVCPWNQGMRLYQIWEGRPKPGRRRAKRCGRPPGSIWTRCGPLERLSYLRNQVSVFLLLHMYI